MFGSAQTACRPKPILTASATGQLSANEGFAVAQCDLCRNDYRKCFQVAAQGKTYTYGSFERATHKLVPSCANSAERTAVVAWRRSVA